MFNLLKKKNPYNYFDRTGWKKSTSVKKAVDAEGNFIPWVNYSYLTFIEPRLHEELRVFEYGSGASSIYYEQRVGEYYAAEDNLEWLFWVKERVQNPENIILPFGKYYDAIEGKGEFDIVIVDSKQRHRCVYKAIDHLTAEGVIILDDSERVRYEKVFKKMVQNGFKRLDFCGLSPVIPDYKCATIFYREGNCLGI